MQDFPSVAVVGLGLKGSGYCQSENWDGSRENVRAAVAGKGIDAWIAILFVKDTDKWKCNWNRHTNTITGLQRDKNIDKITGGSTDRQIHKLDGETTIWIYLL